MQVRLRIGLPSEDRPSVPGHGCSGERVDAHGLQLDAVIAAHCQIVAVVNASGDVETFVPCNDPPMRWDCAGVGGRWPESLICRVWIKAEAG